MFNSNGILLPNSQSSVSGDKNGGISGVNLETSKKASQDLALQKASSGQKQLTPGEAFNADMANRKPVVPNISSNSIPLDNKFKGPVITNKK